MPAHLPNLARVVREGVILDLVEPGNGHSAAAGPVVIASDQVQVLSYILEGADVRLGLAVALDAFFGPGLGHGCQRVVPLLHQVLETYRS